MTAANSPAIRDYDDWPEGWSRVGAALTDRLPWTVVAATRDDWIASRFSPSIAMAFVVDHGILSPAGVEQWQRDTGLDHP